MKQIKIPMPHWQHSHPKDSSPSGIHRHKKTQRTKYWGSQLRLWLGMLCDVELGKENLALRYFQQLRKPTVKGGTFNFKHIHHMPVASCFLSTIALALMYGAGACDRVRLRTRRPSCILDERGNCQRKVTIRVGDWRRRCGHHWLRPFLTNTLLPIIE